jgi:hypothetical protein
LPGWRRTDCTIWMAGAVIEIEQTSAPNGGTARG